MTGKGEDNQKLLAALRHPLRRRILREMEDGEPASPSELAARLDASLSNVSYHVRVLYDCEALGQVELQQVRGATKHLYRLSLESDWARKLLSDEDQ